MSYLHFSVQILRTKVEKKNSLLSISDSKIGNVFNVNTVPKMVIVEGHTNTVVLSFKTLSCDEPLTKCCVSRMRRAVLL